MKTTRYMVALCLLAFLSVQTVVAQTQDKPSPRQLAKAEKQLRKNEARQAKEKERELKNKPTEKDVVYIFGVAVNFNDSVVYMTDIQELNFMKLEDKTKFLPYRADLSQQLKEYLESKKGLQNETCSMFYDVDRRKTAKRHDKMKKRCLSSVGARLEIIEKSDFTFTKPQWEN